MAYNESQVHNDEINETLRNDINHKPLTTREEAIKRIYDRQHGQKFSYYTDRTGRSRREKLPLAHISEEEMTAELEVMKDPLAKRFRDVVLERIRSRERPYNIPLIEFAEIKAEEEKFIKEIGEKSEKELKRRTPGRSQREIVEHLNEQSIKRMNETLRNPVRSEKALSPWVEQALMRIRARGEEGPPIGPLEIIEELKSMRKEWEDIKYNDDTAKFRIANIKAEEERIRAELEEWDAETAEALRNPDRSQKEIAADSKRIRSEKENRRTTSKNGGKSKKRTGRLHKKKTKKTRRTHRK